MDNRSKGSAKPIEAEDGDSPLEAAKLEPIHTVKRELTRPDGTKLTVDVPVYPPFRLQDRQERLPKRKSVRRAPPKKGAAAPPAESPPEGEKKGSES